MNELSITDMISQPSVQVAVWGNGVSGRAAHKLLLSKGFKAELFDEKGRVFNEDDAQKYSLIVQSPGFKPDHDWKKLASKFNRKVISEVDLGFSFSDHAEMVAITGTNGKTTLTELLGYLSRKLHFSCFELGNIGTPLSEAVAEKKVSQKIIFHETSSFQANSSQVFKADFLLWTNFGEDHLDYHRTEKEYFFSKLRLAHGCANPDNVFLGSSVYQYAQKHGIEINPHFNHVRPLIAEDLPCSVHAIHRSIPQLENLAFAMSWLRCKGISPEQFFGLLEGYKPPSYRLEHIAQIQNIGFWNDSKSTNLGSTLAACKSFAEKVTWIGGGKSKGQELEAFASSLHPYLQGAFLIGETARELSSSLQKRGIKSVVCESLKIAVSKAFAFAKQSTDILFSPGFASFDMFSDYTDRGNSFQSLVFDLKSTHQVTTKLSTNHLQASY
jgi:UDP-N-acetylmuramoylalanine--D-glutamate ligase